MGPIISFAHQAVAQRYRQAETQKDEQKADMLDSFIRSELSQREAESEANIQILAGSDSTSTVFRMTMLYIVTIQRVYYVLRQEIDEGVQSSNISPVITDSEAQRLPYLQAVIWEGLRMTLRSLDSRQRSLRLKVILSTASFFQVAPMSLPVLQRSRIVRTSLVTMPISSDLKGG